MTRVGRIVLLLTILAAVSFAAIRHKTPPAPVVDPKCHVNPHTGVPTSGFRDLYEEYACFNNDEICNPSVRNAISSVDRIKWGQFDFFCFQGTVSQVYTAVNSSISSNHMEFIRENPGLFGLPPNAVIELESSGRGMQVYRGIRVATGVDLLRKRNAGRYGDENFDVLHAFLSDTSGWNFDPKSNVSKDQAISVARKYWGSARPENVAGWRIDDANYWIRHDPPAGSDCPRAPGGAWFIRAFGEPYPRKGLTKSYMKEAIVDGKTGRACSFSGTGDVVR